MDKLRALQYFVAAAEERSFSAAARRMEVSIPAVAKLIDGLERSLGASLFIRSPRGLTLSAEGHGYLEACRPLLEQLAAADERIAGKGRLRGTVGVGVWPTLATYLLAPALPRFHARYPDLRIDLRYCNEPSDAAADAMDVLLLLGWPDAPDMVHRRLGALQHIICAAPGYWAEHGIPQHPRELERHECLAFRTPKGTVLDLWKFERDGSEEAIAVGGRLVSDNVETLISMAIAGEGVVHLSEASLKDHVGSGRLAPALREWRICDTPLVNLFYRSNGRQIGRIRAFIDFVVELFEKPDNERPSRLVPSSGRPRWYHRAGRASAAVRRQP
jgi:LysR family transcriptional regulator for bpeEF and oprC